MSRSTHTAFMKRGNPNYKAPTLTELARDVKTAYRSHGESAGRSYYAIYRNWGGKRSFSSLIGKK